MAFAGSCSISARFSHPIDPLATRREEATMSARLTQIADPTSELPRHPEGVLHQSSEATGVAGQTRGAGRRPNKAARHNHSPFLKRVCLGAAGGLLGTFALQALMTA